MIIIEGQIGVGKTTVGELLEREWDLPLSRELENPDTLALLDRFYADKKRWSFALQVHFLNERFKMIKNIQDQGGGLLDRSIFGDRIFAEVLAHDGDMLPEEFRTYSTLLESMLEHVNPPVLLVYLDCTVDSALGRIQRRNRGLEAGIPRDYLEKLNQRYLRWFSEYDVSPKVMVDTNSLDISTKQGEQEFLELLHPYYNRIFDKE
ncbi:MAG: deoxynucleoside kinase [Spirochaetia bacterium]